MPLLLDQHVAFLHVPRTGGTTIERMLFDCFPKEFCGFRCRPGLGPLSVYRPQSESTAEMERKIKERKFPVNPQHLTYEELGTVVPDLNCWWSFCFVRNPWARLYSDYQFNVKILNLRLPTFSEWATRMLAEAAAGNVHINDNHFRPQHEFTGLGTTIYRYEQFSADIHRMMVDLGPPIEAKVGRYLCTQKYANEYRQDYSPTLIGQVGEFYREDCRRFDYHW